MYEVKMPKFGLSMEEGTVTKWFKKVGDYVKKGDPLVEVESEKIINSLESPFEGYLIAIKTQEGESAKVGEVIALIGEKGEVSEKPEAAFNEIVIEEVNLKEKGLENKEVEPKEEAREGIILASPAAKKLAREYGVDLSKIKGTGPSGRIVESDVLTFIESKKSSRQISKKFPLDPVRKRIMDNLVKSYKETVLVTNITKVDLTNLLRLKSELPEITLTAFFVKVVSEVLKEFKKFNAHFDGLELEMFDVINIGVAFDTGNGLIVPVIKNVEGKSLKEIAENLESIKVKVKENTLQVDDLTNSTFTITNLGMMRTDIFTPVLNGKEVGILGIGRIIKEPAVIDNEIVVRDFAYFSLSYDHRVIDGADAARFLGKLAEILEVSDNLNKIIKI